MLSKKRRIVALIVIVFLIGSITGWAATSGSASIPITAGGVPGTGGVLAKVVAASSSPQFLVYGDYKDGDPKYNDPFWYGWSGAIWWIVPGDLFYVDTTGNAGNVRMTLHFDNAYGLSRAYRYLNVKVNLYKLDSASGEAVGTGNGSTKNFYLDYPAIILWTETVYLDGTPQSRGVDYTIKNHNGEIHFITAPGAGVAVTADYQYWAQAFQANGDPITQTGNWARVTGESVGTGNGWQKYFWLDHGHMVPGSEGIYVDGVLQARGEHADYQIYNNSGWIWFNTAPASGAVITADYQYWDDWEAVADVYMTLQNSSVGLTLSGNTKYCITIDEGSIRTLWHPHDDWEQSPEFWLDVMAA